MRRLGRPRTFVAVGKRGRLIRPPGRCALELRILLALLGVFAMVSGWLKSRARVRDYMGGAGLGVIELLAGFVLLITQGPNMAGPEIRVGLGWAVGALILFSNIQAIFRARRVTRDLNESEGHRLYTQVKFEQALEEAGVEDPSETPEPTEIEPKQDPGDSFGKEGL